jgi:hypothetical protein
MRKRDRTIYRPMKELGILVLVAGLGLTTYCVIGGMFDDELLIFSPIGLFILLLGWSMYRRRIVYSDTGHLREINWPFKKHPFDLARLASAHHYHDVLLLKDRDGNTLECPSPPEHFKLFVHGYATRVLKLPAESISSLHNSLSKAQ